MPKIHFFYCMKKKMIPSRCGLDVCAFVQESECSDSSSLKVLISSDSKIDIFEDHGLLKTFKFDNVCSPDSKDDVLESIVKSVTKDVVESLNRVIFVYNLSGNKIVHSVDMLKTLCSFTLKNMCGTVKNFEKDDLSLHVSCLRVDNNRTIDLMQKTCNTSNDLKVFELENHTLCNLTERIVTCTEDVDEIIKIVFQKTMPNTCPDCCHTVVLTTVIVKTRNFDGFEILKTGRFILVDIGVCLSFFKEVSSFVYSKRESFYLIPDTSPVAKDFKLRNCCLSGILKNFLSKSKLSVLISLPSTLFDMEYMYALKIISELQNLRLKPAINEKLILRESIKDYADEIKVLEKDLLVLKNNNGILINKQKYRSLKNRSLLSESQLRDLHEARKASNDNLKNKKEILARFQQEVKLTSIKFEKEIQKLKFSKVSFEETEQKKISLNQKKMEKVDLCASLNNLINLNLTSLKNQNSQLVKIKYTYVKSSSSKKSLNEDINSHLSITTIEQNKLKDRIELLLLQLKDIIFNSTIQQKKVVIITSEFYKKFEEILKLWKQRSTNLMADFHNFLERILNHSFSVKNNLLTEVTSLNFTEDMVEIMKKNKAETLNLIASCSTKIQMSVENSIKLVYEFLCLLAIIQGKVKEQLKKLDSSLSSHVDEGIKLFSSTNSTMATMHQYLNAHLDLSSKINSEFFSHHQELKQCANNEFMKIKEAFSSLKELFCLHQTFVIDKWLQKQTYLSNVKEINGASESLQLCTEEHPILLDKFRQHSVSSFDELYSISRDQIVTVENLGKQLKQIFNEIRCNVKDCSEENKKKVSQQENDIRDNLEIQNEKISKCMKTTGFLVEEFGQSISEGLQLIRNYFFAIKDLKKNNDVNHIFELRNYLNDYSNILRLSEIALQPLPEIIPKKTENLEESLVFNQEELLSSTPSNCHERSKNIIDYKTKFLNRLRKIAEVEINYGWQNNLTLDQERIMNASAMSLPSMSIVTKGEIHNNRSLGNRRVVKGNFMK